MLKKRIGVIMYQTSLSKGQELVAQRMVREFNTLGHKSFLITSNYHDGAVVGEEGRTKREGFSYSLLDHELGIPIIRVDSYVAKWPPRRIIFRDFISILEKIVDSFHLDVLITHSTLWNGPEETARFIEWRRYMKRIGGYRDPLVFCHMSHFQEPTAKRYSLTERSFRVAWNRLTLPQIFSTANLILVVTPLEKDAKIKMGAKPEKCFLYPSGVDDHEFQHCSITDKRDIDVFLNRCGVREGQKMISYLGSLEERKNPLAVLKVAELLHGRKDIHFVIAGKGQSAYAEKVIEMSKTLPNVTCVGEIDGKEKVLLIESSRVNILLSRSEALGLSQLEFLYSGVPVVTSGVEGQAWLIRHDEEGFHVSGPDDTEGAAAAVQRLCDDDALWSRLSSNARKRAAELTVSKLTEQLDGALTTELTKERGLTVMPEQVRATIAEPENVLKSWSSGNWGVISTGKRLFIRRGVISRKVTEIPYRNITSIEHTRRYPWKTLVVGATISILLWMGFFATWILPQPFTSMTRDLLNFLEKTVFMQQYLLNALLVFVTVAPFLIAATAFAAEARTGFVLRGPGKETIYLPGKFKEVITFVRNMQDVDFERMSFSEPGGPSFPTNDSLEERES